MRPETRECAMLGADSKRERESVHASRLGPHMGIFCWAGIYPEDSGELVLGLISRVMCWDVQY